jgi:hypothetical protein
MTTPITRRSLFKVMAAAGIAAGPLLSKVMAATESVQNGTSIVAAIFFDSYGAVALRRALRYAGDDGFVASLPALLHARANGPYDNIIWNTWFTANSEESVVTTKQGNHVVVTVHGGGIFAKPERLLRSLRADLSRHNPEGLTGQYAAKISEQEGRDLLQGRLSDGAEIPVYAFAEFKRGIKDLPRRYGVVLDFELAKKTKSDYDSFEALRNNPVLMVRAGGVEPLRAYLDKAQARHNTKVMGNWHPFNRIDPDEPQTRILEIAGNKGGVGSEGSDQRLSWGYGEDYGITGNGGFPDMARYVAVAPRDVSTSLQDLDFEL